MLLETLSIQGLDSPSTVEQAVVASHSKCLSYCMLQWPSAAGLRMSRGFDSRARENYGRTNGETAATIFLNTNFGGRVNMAMAGWARPPLSISVTATKSALPRLPLKGFSLQHQRDLHCFGRSSAQYRKGRKLGRERIQCMYNEEPDDQDDEDDNFEFLFQVAISVIGRASKNAAKVAMDLLPPMISAELVTFSVNGIVILGLLWTLKAVLELACMVGSMLFVGILLLRGLSSTISYIHLCQNQDIDPIGNIRTNLKTKYS